MADRSERTPEEREAARLERERRRQDRGGGFFKRSAPEPAQPRQAQPPAEPPPTAPPQPRPAQPAPTPPPARAQPAPTPPPAQTVTAVQTAAPPPEVEAERQPEPGLEPEQQIEPEQPAEPEQPEPEQPAEPGQQPSEPPAATEPPLDAEPPHDVVVWHDVVPPLDEEPPRRQLPRPHRPHRPQRRPRPARPPAGPKQSHSFRGRIVALVALILAIAVVWFCDQLFQPFHGSGSGSVFVTVPAHSSVGKIGDLLARDKVISSSFFFQVRATLSGERDDLRAGTYKLKRGMSYGSVLSILTTAPAAAKVTELTIVPGHTRALLSALLHSQGIAGSYLTLTRQSRLLNPRSYGAPAGTSSLEGFLFPDTFQLREPITIAALVADQLTTFKQQFKTVNLSYARKKNLTPYDVLIIASMIEGEAQTAKDRALVASVIYNRLRDNMPLQLDATTRYATGNYTSPLTQAQTNSNSPYNTRIHTGLTPTPIDSPSRASIYAAAHPANTNDLYFVVEVCGNGAMLFTSNYQQFLQDSQRYQNARAARGGRSPANCT
jgi:uncharacterized YceG family protein